MVLKLLQPSFLHLHHQLASTFSSAPLPASPSGSMAPHPLSSQLDRKRFYYKYTRFIVFFFFKIQLGIQIIPGGEKA